MASRKIFYFIVSFILLAGVSLTYYRHAAFDVPWLPGEKRQIWSIEAKVEFAAHRNEPITVSLALPTTQQGLTRLGESTASLAYGLSFTEKGKDYRAIWTKREARGKQEMYYKVDFLVDPNAQDIYPSLPPAIRFVEYPEPYRTAARDLIDSVYQRSADPYSFSRELLRLVHDESNAQNVGLLRNYVPSERLFVDLLHNAGIAARIVRALHLEDGRRRQGLQSYLQVFSDEQNWTLFDLDSGVQGRPENILLWEYRGNSVLEVMGGFDSQVSFSMLMQEKDALSSVLSGLNHDGFLGFSIDSLPLEEQSLFKGILLIPIGVLIVVLLRVLIGIKTSGTFMPVLIAVAFIQTSLITGLVGFLLVVGIGLIIRSYLSYLNLLLVARISAVIITVIGIIAIFSVLSFQLGLTEGLKVTFFPMIILSWTIERMSVLWEEEGPKEVFKQGGGSLLVAVLAFLAMNNPLVRHLSFNFLGLQLIILAIVLLLGNYTGYRLLELRRFKPMIDQDKP